MGSSKKPTVGYRYYLGMHMILTHGPIDALTEIKVDDRLAWIGNNTGTQIALDAPGLFGGDDREGGVSGDVDVLLGAPTQAKNSYLQTQLGNDIPAFRGVASIVLRQPYLGNNPYLKRWSFRGRRVNIRSDNSEQWYVDKASIFSSTRLGQGAVWRYKQITAGSVTPASPIFPTTGWSYGEAPFGIFPDGFPSPLPISTEWNADTWLWVENDVTLSVPRKITLFIKVENACFVYLNEVLIESFNPLNTDITGFDEGFVELDLPVGTSKITILALDEVASGPTDATYLQVFSSDQVDMNPAHIIRECLTDTSWGMGYLEDDVDDVSFMAAADTLFDEKMGISLLWDRQIAIEDFIAEIVRHINATLYIDRITGKYTLKLIRNDYDTGDLLTLDESNIDKVSDYNRVDQGDAINSVTVIYWDSDTGDKAGITADDIGMINDYGSVIGTTIQYPGFTNSKLAARVAERDLKTFSSPLLSATILANREASSLNIGDVFKFEYPDYHEGFVVMRVHQIALGDGRRNKVKITATEDIFFIPETSIVTTEDPGWIEPGGEPIVPPFQLVFESPYYELVQQLGQTQVDNQITTTPEIGYLQAAAIRPTNGLNAKIWVDPGSGYEESALVDFAPNGLLNTAIDAEETDWVLKDFSDLDLIDIGSHGQVGSEIFSVDSLDPITGEITVGRAVLDTLPSSHNEDDRVVFWDEYSASDEVEYADGEIVDVKILTNSNQGTLSIDDAVESELTFDGRAARPYRPANFEIDGTYAPSSYTFASTAVLTWRHRDRIQETSGTHTDYYTDSDIGPESGTTYTVEVDVDDGTTLTSNWFTTNVGSLKTYTFDDSVNPLPSGTLFVTFRVVAIRDTLRSFTTPSFTVPTASPPTNLQATYTPATAPADLAAELF